MFDLKKYSTKKNKTLVFLALSSRQKKKLPQRPTYDQKKKAR